MNSKEILEGLKEKAFNQESQVFENDNFLKILFDTIPNPIFYKDKNGIYRYCNDAFSKTILGIEKEKILGRTLYELLDVIPKKYADLYYEKDNELFSNPGTQNYNAQVKCADGKLRNYNFSKSTFEVSGEVKGLVCIMFDITEYKNTLSELNEKNEELNSLSITDCLTGLYNRRYFQEIFERKLSLLDRRNHKFSFALVDIDFFKDYNDWYGHHAGDKVLAKISKIIKNTFNRPNDYAFRLGGEEFGLLFDVEKSEDAFFLVETLRQNIENAKIEASNMQVSDFITVSIGLGNINKLPQEKIPSNFIYDEVDKLLYFSKGNGRNQSTMKEF